MLIRSIQAENFMGFWKLDISQLPERGLIGIEGPNESGKTSVGDAILFALFGKPPRDDALPVSKLIRWKSDALSVELCFSIPGEGDFFIHREIDKFGTNYVKLLDAESKRELAAGHIDVVRAISDLLKVEPDEFRQSFFLSQHRSLEGGLDPEFLERVIGVNQIRATIGDIAKEIEELERSYSLYDKDIQRNRVQLEKYDESTSNEAALVERASRLACEADAGDRRRAEFDDGLKAVRSFGEQLGRRASQLDSARAASMQKIAKAFGGLAEKYQAFENRCGVGEPDVVEWSFLGSRRDTFDRLKKLGSSLADFARRFSGLRGSFKDRARELAQTLDPDSADSLITAQRHATEKLADQTKTCHRRSIRAVFVLVAVGLIGAIWGVVFSGIPQAEPFVEFVTKFGVVAENARTFLGATFAGFAIVFLLFAASRAFAGVERRRLEVEENGLAKEIRDSRAEADALEAVLSASRDEEVAKAYGVVETARSTKFRSVQEELSQTFEDYWCAGGDAAYRDGVSEFCASQKRFREELKREAQSLDKLVKDVGAETKKKRSEKDRLDGKLREAASNKPKRDKLAEATNELKEKASQIRSDLTLRRASIQLLEETSGRVRSRVAPTVEEFVRLILPALTGNRYRDVRLSDDWTLELFASDKSDFMYCSELSGGTLESLRLALVLAACQCLIHCRSRQKHFLFLDEPFTLIDSGRARSILECLRRLSPEVQQIFVVQPSFDAAQREVLDETIRISPDSPSLTWTGRPAPARQDPVPRLTNAMNSPTADGSGPSVDGESGDVAGEETPDAETEGDEASDLSSSSTHDSAERTEEGAPNPPSWAVRR